QDLAFIEKLGIHLRLSDGGAVAHTTSIIGGSSEANGVPTVFVQAKAGDYTAQIEVEAGRNNGVGLHRLDSHNAGIVGNIGTNRFLSANEPTNDFVFDNQAYVST